MYEEDPMEERKPYKNGYSHGEKGKTRNDNPYDNQSPEGKDWDWGWLRGIIKWLKKPREER